MAEKGPPQRLTTSGEEATFDRSKIRRKKCIRCCGCIAALLLMEAIVVVVLILTVFRIKDPIIKMNGIRVEKLELVNGSARVRPGSNMTLTVDVSVKNPNAATFEHGSATSELYYGAKVVGEVRSPAGVSKPRRTERMNVTVDLMMTDELGQNLIGLGSEEGGKGGVMSIGSLTRVGGKVKILKVIRKHVIVKMNCTSTFNITTQAIQQVKCKRKLKL
ncbi:uncharacterized protein LOC127802672 [Diospyros lotus]|uniref:uncharacterized protein LOC127802672 n=1 Tax=Diospyros lotus TaxID=55363 RepID=UPI00225694D5|nr:uncharacterized protein LOC127802672 [Diospyros lotus]